jgi:hypothetical protein
MELLLVLAVIGSALAAAQSKLPNAPVREVTDDYFGTKVTDPTGGSRIQKIPR